MIHLVKEKGKFVVYHVSKNHEMISHSRGNTTRKGAYKNIRAHMNEYGNPENILLQDNTNGTPAMIRVYHDRVEHLEMKPGKPFRPIPIPRKTK